MKKLISLLVISMTLFALPAMSQTYGERMLTMANGTTLDTATNAAAEAFDVPTSGRSALGSVIVEVTKISGTVAGTVKLQGQNRSGGQWVDLQSENLTDATAAYLFEGEDALMTLTNRKKVSKLRILVTTTGTQSCSYRATSYTVPLN